MNYWLFLIPVFSALTGWLIVRILFWSLFHPATPKHIAGITIQGLLPSKELHLRQQLLRTVSKAFPVDQLEEKISRPENLEKILPIIEGHIDDFLRNKLGKELPMIGMFIGDKTVGKVKEAFMKEIEALFPQIMMQYAATLKQDFNVEQKLGAMMDRFPVASIGQLFRGNMKKQLRLAGWGAATIGFVLGLVQLAIFLLL